MLKLSKQTIWLIAILLFFLLLLIFIWLWYDAKIHEINSQAKHLTQVSMSGSTLYALGIKNLHYKPF